MSDAEYMMNNYTSYNLQGCWNDVEDDEDWDLIMISDLRKVVKCFECGHTTEEYDLDNIIF